MTKVNISIDGNINIQYTDNIFINSNDDGIVFDVGQRQMNTNQIKIVARFGMSRIHAKKLLKNLSELLLLTEEKMKSLPKTN